MPHVGDLVSQIKVLYTLLNVPYIEILILRNSLMNKKYPRLQKDWSVIIDRSKLNFAPSFFNISSCEHIQYGSLFYESLYLLQSELTLLLDVDYETWCRLLCLYTHVASSNRSAPTPFLNRTKRDIFKIFT